MSRSADQATGRGNEDPVRDRAWMARIARGGEDGADALVALYAHYEIRLRNKLRWHGVADSDCDDVLNAFMRLELFTGKATYNPAAPPLAWLLKCLKNRALAWHEKQKGDVLAHAHVLADPDDLVHDGDAKAATPDDCDADLGPGTLPPPGHPDPTFDAVARRQRQAKLQQDIAQAESKGGKWAAAIELVELIRRYGWTFGDVAFHLYRRCRIDCTKDPCSQALCDNGTEDAARKALRNARDLLAPYFQRRAADASSGVATKGG